VGIPNGTWLDNREDYKAMKREDFVWRCEHGTIAFYVVAYGYDTDWYDHCLWDHHSNTLEIPLGFLVKMCGEVVPVTLPPISSAAWLLRPDK